MNIETWLRELGLDRYADAFRANEIDHTILPTLTAEDLSDIGVTIVGHRRKILNAAALLQDEQASESPTTALEAERRHLTLMFVDLVGSTAISGRLDPEDLRKLMRRFQNAVAGEVTRFRGHVAKFLGDGVLAYFGFPRANEDDAERSVRTALSIMEALTRIETPQEIPLQARIGIATGLVVVGDLIGEGPAQEPAVIGETPNLAARLQAEAKPGQILISTATRQLLGHVFAFDDLGSRKLKGIKEPVQIHAVSAERIVESRFAARHAGEPGRMAGRDQELALILERWRQTLAGEGQCVRLIGEAGIGKSRIAQAFIDAVADDAPIRLSYQCSPHHRDSALYPAIRQLILAADFAPGDDPKDKLDKLETLLELEEGWSSENAPLIAALLGIYDDKRYGKLDLSPQQQRMRTLHAFVGQLLGLARQRSVLLLIEDAHWIDPTTLELIEQSIDAIVQAPVLILVTTRPDDQVELRGHPNVTSLALNRLSQQAATSMIQQLLGGMDVPQSIIVEIVAKTDGVPLFVEEVAKAVVEEGVLGAEVPASLQDSLMARLDRIPDARRFAQTAAVIGREFDFRLLQRLSKAEDAELKKALSGLVDAELVFCRGTPPDASYTFKHTLVRDAAYESLLRERRKNLHGVIADLLRESQETLDPADETLAQHLALAERFEAAIETRIAAAERARDQSAYKEALGLIGNAASLLPQIAGGGVKSELDIQLELLRAEVIQALHGPSEAAFGAYRRVEDLTHQAGDHRREFVGAWGLWFLNLQSMDLPNATRQTERLTALARISEDRDYQLQASHAKWTTAFYKGDIVAASEHARVGCERYDPERHYPSMLRFGSHDTGCCARYHMSKSSCILGFPETSVKFAREAMKLAHDIGHAGSLVIALNMDAIVRQMMGDLDGLKRASADFSILAERHGMSRFAAAAPIIEGWIAVCEGGGSSALAQMQHGIATLVDSDSLMRVSYFFGILAEA